MKTGPETSSFHIIAITHLVMLEYLIKKINKIKTEPIPCSKNKDYILELLHHLVSVKKINNYMYMHTYTHI